MAELVYDLIAALHLTEGKGNCGINLKLGTSSTTRYMYGVDKRSQGARASGKSAVYVVI